VLQNASELNVSKEIQELAHRLRDLIDEIHPESVEVLWPKQKIAGFGVGPKNSAKHFGIYFCEFHTRPTLVFGS